MNDTKGDRDGDSPKKRRKKWQKIKEKKRKKREKKLKKRFSIRWKIWAQTPENSRVSEERFVAAFEMCTRLNAANKITQWPQIRHKNDEISRGSSNAVWNVYIYAVISF